MKDAAEFVAHEFVRAIHRRDVEGLAGLMTEGHRFVDSLGNVVEGREKMRAGWAAYFRMVPDYSIVVEESYCVERARTAGPSATLAATDSAPNEQMACRRAPSGARD